MKYTALLFVLMIAIATYALSDAAYAVETRFLWRLQQVGEAYRLTTAFRGPGMCLDIFNGGADNNRSHLTQCGNYSGQIWYINPSWKPVK